MTRALTLFTVATAFLFAGCRADDPPEGCQKDGDCPAGLFCDRGEDGQSGVCKCRTDDACGDPKIYRCNDYGKCQERPACIGNKDCDQSGAIPEICDSSDQSGGKCIPARVGDRPACGSSVHCAFNHYCSPSASVCVEGCRNSGDCQIGHICIAGDCTDGATADDCTTCPVQPNPDPTYCDYGEFCTPAGECSAVGSGGGLCNRCQPDGSVRCDANLTCIMDPEAAGQHYCTSMCKFDAQCPNGFVGCGGVILVFSGCQGNQDCDGGARCIKPSESDEGFCEITSQADCEDPFGTQVCVWGSCLTDGSGCSNETDCLCSSGRCVTSGMPCTNGVDCQTTFVQIETADGASYGVCETNQRVCGKQSGLSCDDLSQAATCREL